MTMLKQLGLQKLSVLINKILATDPLALNELAQLNTKTLCVRVDKTPIVVWVEFSCEGVQLKPAESHALASVNLTGSPSALLKFAKTESHTQMLMDKKIKIQGDLDVLMELKKIQQRIMIDWEGLLAEYIGDFTANRLMMLARHTKKKIAHHLGLLREDSLNYLHHEAVLLPTAPEVDAFYHDIRELRRNIERLETRLKGRVKS